MKPWMSDVECDALRLWLDDERPSFVLEWGAGGSTLTFPCTSPGLLRWVSIEHNFQWYESVVRELWMNELVADELVAVTLIRPNDSSYTDEQEEWDDTFEQFADYVTFPFLTHLTFDLIIVDGRCRNACLLIAPHLLNIGGSVILHDCNVEHPAGTLTYGTGKAPYRSLWQTEGLEALKPEI